VGLGCGGVETLHDTLRIGVRFIWLVLVDILCWNVFLLSYSKDMGHEERLFYFRRRWCCRRKGAWEVFLQSHYLKYERKCLLFYFVKTFRFSL